MKNIEKNNPGLIPYRGPIPKDSKGEIIVADALPGDERLSVPLGDQVWTRPLRFVPAQGYWLHFLRVKKSGVLNRHRHASPVNGYVLKGNCYYLEHDWVATEGSYVFAGARRHTYASNPTRCR